MVFRKPVSLSVRYGSEGRLAGRLSVCQLISAAFSSNLDKQIVSDKLFLKSGMLSL